MKTQFLQNVEQNSVLLFL